jgi:hypothetical protein
MTLPFRLLVVTNHAITPAINPAIDPPMHPHLLALDQEIAIAIGNTAEPRMTPMNVCEVSIG